MSETVGESAAKMPGNENIEEVLSMYFSFECLVLEMMAGYVFDGIIGGEL